MARIAIIGAGTMGSGLARLFAPHGHDVRSFDERPEVAAAVARHVSGVRPADSLIDAVGGAEFCIEAVVEDLAVKRAVFTRLAEAAPADALLATNTSALLVSDIAQAVPPDARRRVLGTHFFNPPDVVPAVEVVQARETEPEMLARVVELLTAVGKVAAVVRDTPGFVANRIQHAMIAEAWRCMEDGVATPEAIDAIVSASFGFRLFAYGPFRLGDFNGLDVYESVMRTLREAYGDRFGPPATLVEHVRRGAVGVKAGEGVFSYAGDSAAEAVKRRDDALRRLARIHAEEIR